MNYYKQDDYRYNNQSPWKLDGYEIAFALADNCVRTPANRNPQKCWIPTIMGPKKIEKPKIIQTMLGGGPFINDTQCRPRPSSTIRYANYMEVNLGDNEYYAHKWVDHGAELWLKPINNDILELYLDTEEDPSYCLSCLLEHPGCNTVHGCHTK